jgi:hypothetical protein
MTLFVLGAVVGLLVGWHVAMPACVASLKDKVLSLLKK